MSSAFCTQCGAALNGARFCTSCGAAVVDETVDASTDAAGTELTDSTSKVPRITAPLLGDDLPPLATVPPAVATLPPLYSAPAPVPGAKKSPWPWIIVAALLVAGAGFGTWWFIEHDKDGAQASPVISTQSAAPAPTGSGQPSVSTSTPAVTDSEDATIAASQLKALNSLVDAHVGFVKAINRIDRMCNVTPGSGPTTPMAYDRTALAHDVEVVRALQAERAAFDSTVSALSGRGSATARQVTGDLTAMNRLAVDATDQTVRWAEQALSQSGGCDMNGIDQVTSDPNVDQRLRDRANAWGEFKAFASHFPSVDWRALQGRLVDPLDPRNTNDTNLF